MHKILIADDSLTSRMIVKRCLEMVGLRGCTFIEAKDGQEALELASKENPELIMADLNMPRLDGEKLLTALKENPTLNAIPVIIASSAANPTRKERLTALGAHAVISKPVSPANLKEALGSFLSA